MKDSYHNNNTSRQSQTLHNFFAGGPDGVSGTSAVSWVLCDTCGGGDCGTSADDEA